MTPLQFITLYALASIIALPIALAFLATGGRADDLSRTRNNAAGEKGEGGGVAGHLVQRNKTNREA